MYKPHHRLNKSYSFPYILFILQTVLDQHGCPVHCSVMSDISQDNQFVIGRQDVCTVKDNAVI